MPESGIQQMQHSMLSTPYIQVHRHPVLLSFFVQHALGVGGIYEAQVVPARACPLWHCARFSAGWLACREALGLTAWLLTGPAAQATLQVNI